MEENDVTDMCLEEHPIFHVMCLKLDGHKGQHWFTVRWTDRDGAIADANAAITAAAHTPHHVAISRRRDVGAENTGGYRR